MKIASITCTVIGLLGALMAVLTALEVSPGFVDFGIGFGELGIDAVTATLTTAFWGGLSVLMLLAAIALGIIAEKE
jgi:hypothetical protein